MNTKRILAMILSMMMLLSLLPTGFVVFADEATTTCGTEGCTETYTDGICSAGHFQAANLHDNGTAEDTSDDYYEIGNVGQLYWFAALVNGTLDDVEKNASANAKLTSDITDNTAVLVDGSLNTSAASGFRTWTPICEYQGSFD